MTTRLIHVRDMRDFPGAVYIGRAMPHQQIAGSIWHNPFRPPNAIDQFSDYLRDPQRGRHLLGRLPELRGRVIACWCVRAGDPDQLPGWPARCHGEVLMGLLNRYTDAQLVAFGEGDLFCDDV